MTLDLTKPMRWKDGDKVRFALIWHDEFGAICEINGYRQWYPRAYLERHAENIPPEPPKPVGYDEFDAWLASQMPQNTVIGDPHWWTPKIVRAAIRYLRADLAESTEARDYIRETFKVLCGDDCVHEHHHLPQMVRELLKDQAPEKRKVMRLTSYERQKLHEADTWCDLDSAFIAIMAARGIEVGE